LQAGIIEYSGRSAKKLSNEVDLYQHLEFKPSCTFLILKMLQDAYSMLRVLIRTSMSAVGNLLMVLPVDLNP